MRLVKQYTFNIKTKIPYSEWPDIVHRFLSENHLASHRFLYHFEDITVDGVPDGSGCARILKDCPALGEIRHNAYYNGNLLLLSNIDKQDDFSEAEILPLMKKIHRRYGFSQCSLYYFDIDFFGKRTHFDLDYTAAQRICKADNIPFDPTILMDVQPLGSGITLHRDACGDNFLMLSIDLLHHGTIMDATPYYESMKKLLPKIKSETSLNIYLTDAEKQHYEQINLSAAPMLESCRQYFEERLPFTSSQNLFPSNYSVAKPLKAIGKKHGFTYKLVWSGGVYALEKRTEKGNVIFIEFDCGPSHYNLGAGVSYQGLGFKHNLGCSNQTPTNQQEADEFLEKVVSIVSEFENGLLPALDELFPETPSWFVPSD